MKTIALDFETYFHKKEYSIRGMGNWRYCHDDRFDPYLLTVYDGSESWAGKPDDLNWDMLHGATLLAHNAGFERAVTSALAEQGRIPVLDNQWNCTANLTSYIGNVRSLKDALEVLEHKKISKAIRDDMSGKTWAEAVRNGTSDALVKYALGDVIECWNLWTKYSPRWPLKERALSELTMRQCERGVRIDIPLLHQYKQILQEVIFNLEKSLPWTEAGAKPSSPIAIAEKCREVGIPAPPIKGEDEEGFDLWERTYGPKYPWVYGAGQWRQLNKLLTMVETIEDRLRPDDTIDFSLLYFGGHTGRWSGGGSGLNMQNLRKVPLFIKSMKLVPPPLGLNAKDFKAWVEASTDFQLDVRKLFIARAGKKFILADLSQIEPRVLAWLTGNTKLLEMLKGGMSIYDAFARLSMGWEGGVLKKENPDLYALAKIQVLGLGYGCGWLKFIAIAAGYGVTLDEMQSRTIVSNFRESNVPITRLWGQLDDAFRRSVKGNFTMDLPSGRTLNYNNVYRQTTLTKDFETGEYKNKENYTAEIGKFRKSFYGGKLTENGVQAIARDIFGEQLIDLEENVGDVIFHVHDEAITEVDLSVSCADVERVLSKTPEWMPGLPVCAEARESQHYLK